MLKSKFFQILIIFCIVFGTSAAIFADTIRLKDGSVIKGHIVGFREGQFTVVIGDGNRSRQMTFFSDEIEAIEFDSNNVSVAANTESPAAVLPSRPNPSTTTSANTRPNEPADNNVIVVGANNQNNLPAANPTPAATPLPATPTPISTPLPTPTPAVIAQTSNPVNNPPSSNPANARPKPIQLNLKVLADNTSNGWTNAGWVVRKGQKIKITGAGRVSLGKGNYATPSGIASLADKDKLMKTEPTGELIAVIGDDNNDFIPIGASKEFVATRDGALFLGINEGNLDDNSGAFEITVEIDPTSGN